MVDTEITSRSGAIQAIYHVGRLSEFMACGELLLGFLDELIADKELIEWIETSVASVEFWETKKFATVFDLKLYRIILYIVIRAVEPRVAVETGVLHGLTTVFLLRALEKNGRGKLISIDLPSYASSGPSNKDGYLGVLPTGKEPGWVVPSVRFSNWEMRLGASREILPGLEHDNAEIDFFCHDSEHTFATVWFELNWAWDRLRVGGALVCDNIEANAAFFDFARRVGRPALFFPGSGAQAQEIPRVGLILK